MADNYAKVKSRKYASDEDAENLLAGILDETEDIAKAEQERIEAELRAKEAREAQRREEENRRRKEAAAAKLSAEMERLEKVEQRRTAKMQALKIEELKERGEWVDPEIERQKLEEKLRKDAEIAAMKQAAEEEARRKHTASVVVADAAAQPQEHKRSNLPIFLAVAVALIAAAGGAGFVMMTGYELDSAAYSKSVFAPKETTIALVEAGFTPIPEAEPVVAEVEEEDEPRAKPRRKARRQRTKAKKPQKRVSQKPSQNKANKKAKALEEALNTDIFGGGF